MPKNALSGEVKVPRLKSSIRPRVLGVQLVNVVVPTGSIPADMPIKNFSVGSFVMICYTTWMKLLKSKYYFFVLMQ